MIDLSNAKKIYCENNSCYYIFSNGDIYYFYRSNLIKKEKRYYHGHIYYALRLNKSNGSSNKSAAFLVATYFVENPNDYKYLSFIDGDKYNIDFSNIRWVKYKFGGKQKKVKEKKTIDVSGAKRIEGYGDYYVFSDGRIYLNNIRGMILLKRKFIYGSYYVQLKLKDKKINRRVSDIVGELFVENNNNGEFISFKDGDNLNVNYENLFWDKKPEKIKFNPRSRIEYPVSNPEGELKKITSIDLVGDFYISNTGRVYRKDNDGVYFEKEYFNINGHKNVVLPYRIKYKKRVGYQQLVNVCVYRLVLVHFHINYSKWRKVSFLDGDRFNCKLSNLKYRCGFNGDIDVEYCKLLIRSNAPIEEILISKYLISKDISYVYDVLQKNKKLIRHITRDKSIPKEDSEDIVSDSMIRCIKQLDRGRYKPDIVESKFIRYFIKILKAECINFYRKNKNTMFGTEKSNAIIDEYIPDIRCDQDNLISEDSETIQEEINEMFSNLY